MRAARPSPVRGVLPVRSEVAAWLDARCVRSPRVWGEAERLHADFTACGGRLERAALVAELTADGRARGGSAGFVCGIGLRQDWGPEDGGARAARERGGRHAV